MGEGTVERVEFDMRGQICPSTLLTALNEINLHQGKLLAGTVRLAFLTDNRDATVTIPESAANMGYAVDVRKEGDYYVIEVGRSAPNLSV